MKPTAKAGWASCDITPPLGLPMVGGKNENSTQVLSPLHAGITILEDGSGQRLVFISLDLCDISVELSELLIRDIANTAGTTPDAVNINCSHTHSAPRMAVEHYATLTKAPPELKPYTEGLQLKLVKTVLAALAGMEEVRIHWHEGTSNIGINRRLPAVDGFLMGPNKEGCYHRQLWVLDIQSQQSDKRCLLFSHGCHPVMVYTFADTTLSPDWPGACREALRKQLGSETHYQFFQGLAGNVRPRILSDFEKKTFRPAVLQEVQAVGEEIAGDVIEALKSEGKTLPLQLAAQRGWFMARQEPAPPREHWEEMRTSKIRINRIIAEYWLSRMEENSIPPFLTQSIPLGLVQFAPHYVMVYLSWEPVAEWYEVLQNILPHHRIVACGYTYHNSRYIPTDELLDEAGYETKRCSPYYRNGPGSFLPGLNDAVGKSLHAMQAAIDTTLHYEGTTP